jgi:hypothetical protein
LVDLPGDDVVGDDRVNASVVVEPFAGVIGDGAGPAIPRGIGSVGRDVAVVGDEVVIGGEVVTVDGADAGATCIGDGVTDEASVVAATAEEAVGGGAAAIQVEALELDISRARGERAVANFEHGFSVGGASPDEIDGSGVVVFISDPGRR